MGNLDFTPASAISSSAARSWAEVDFSALRHNLAQVRASVPPRTAVAAVLKANAYGHGLARVAAALRGAVEQFAVANVTEALELRAVIPDASVMILGPALPDERAVAAGERFLPLISSAEEAEAYSVAARAAGGPPLDVHLCVDTGMGRVGFWQDEAVEAARRIAGLPGLRLTGASTHLPVADEDHAWTRGQLARWKSLVESLREAALPGGVFHALNSAGIIGFGHGAPGSHLVRPGLMLYGSSPIPEFQRQLRPVLTWKTRITLLRDVPAGRSVSYGRTFITPHPMRIATLAAGYGDGFPRRLSNTGAEVLAAGRRCPVLGRVTMDQVLVDVSPAGGEVRIGDEAVFLGAQGEEQILASELAAKSGTIPWEIFTGITARVARISRNAPVHLTNR